MNFWNNPENNSLKMLIIVAVVGAAGFFVYKAMNNGGNTGRVIGTSMTSGLSDINGEAVSPEQGDLLFSQEDTGNACTMTVANATNLEQKITVAGTLAADGNCMLNTQQDNPTSQAMADAVNTKAGAGVNADPETQAGLIFSETVSGKTCTLTVTDNLNRNQSIAVAGMLGADGEDCIPNLKQANAISQGMADAMNGGSSVQ